MLTYINHLTIKHLHMKRIMCSVSVALVVLTSISTLEAQNKAIIENAIRTHKAHLLLDEMSDEIELCVFKDVQFLSSKKTADTVNHWLENHDIDKVSGKISGSDKVKYYSGDISSDKNSYQLLIYYRLMQEGDYKIDEIRIVEE